MTGVIILAAGKSSRLGFPKQTLLYKGKTLLELAVEAGIKSKCSEVMVVLGASAKTIEMGIHHYGVNILVNPNWTEGIASSINWGLNSFKDKTGIDNVVRPAISFIFYY